MNARSNLKRFLLAAVISTGFATYADAATINVWDGVAAGVVTTNTNWTGDVLPTITDDAEFSSTVAGAIRPYTGADMTVNSFNVTNTTGTYTIRQDTVSTTRTLTLGGAGSTANAVTGTAATDLLYAAAGSTFNISNGTGAAAILNLALGQNGTFNIAGTSTINALISGGFGFEKTGAGKLTIAGVGNTYSGGTTLTAGSLFISGPATAATTGQLGTGTLTLSGGVVDTTFTHSAAQTHTLANSVVATASTTTILRAVGSNSANSANLTFSGPVTGSGTLKVDSGLATNHTAGVNFTGDISAFTGTFEHVAYDTSGSGTGSPQANGLTIGGNATGATNGALAKFVTHGVQNRTSNGRTLRVDGGTAGVFKMGELSSAINDGGFILATTNDTSLEVGALNTSTTYNGGFGDNSALSLVKVGSGTLTLANVSSMYSGTSTVRAGTLAFTDDVANVSVTGNMTLSTYNASTDTITSAAANGLAVGDTVKFNSATSTLPTGVIQSAVYYVTSVSGNDFKVSATPGGAAVNLTGSITISTGTVMHVGTLGSANSAVQLGDAGSATTPIVLRMDSTGTGLTQKTFARPISVNAFGSSTTTFGGGVDADSTFSGAISLSKDVNLTSAALGANSVKVSGVISSTGAFGLTKVGAGNATLAAINTYGGNTTVSDGVLITSSTGRIVNNGSANVFLSAPDDTVLGNAVFARATASLLVPDSYAGLGSQSIAGGGALGTTADLLAGSDTSGTDAFVGMQWRQRTAGDIAASVISDVLNLGGMVNTANPGDGFLGLLTHGETDMFVLQMSYDSSIFVSDADEAFNAASGFLIPVWNNAGVWENSVLGNFGAGNNVPAFQGDAAWTADTTLGHWGIDTANNKVWAVLNHNSEFAVVPEPSTFALAGVGLVGLVIASRRKKRA